ncbi:hypothetical protein B0A48_15308 [Cryoendolithus antarcticus]|uniref:Uncharacterized protein n=1 Tax=Cryoendolithus antarcticus TaxID=1507870 RepID=A0A1V8SHM6_9PEZI|nr:hypothetical protein B0A48_15308 [Cryoendolithus antarcticus]
MGRGGYNKTSSSSSSASSSASSRAIFPTSATLRTYSSMSCTMASLTVAGGEDEGRGGYN